MARFRRFRRFGFRRRFRRYRTRLRTIFKTRYRTRFRNMGGRGNLWGSVKYLAILALICFGAYFVWTKYLKGKIIKI
jgi:hypothetical protein